MFSRPQIGVTSFRTLDCNIFTRLHWKLHYGLGSVVGNGEVGSGFGSLLIMFYPQHEDEKRWSPNVIILSQPQYVSSKLPRTYHSYAEPTPAARAYQVFLSIQGPASAPTRERSCKTPINAISNAAEQFRHLLPLYKNNGGNSGGMHTQARRAVMDLLERWNRHLMSRRQSSF